MKRLWFKAKNYGWGWYPVTWEGWLATLVFVLCIGILEAALIYQKINVFLFCMLIIVLCFVLIWVCYKTGEKPRWRWGK